jgi:lipopolysaccharide/colanic/teichoic acid biosynthesis glycosyltransferase
LTQAFVITGASGFIGSQLVPRLKALGYELLLVGRDSRSLDRLFPEIPNCRYEQIAESAKGYDALIHLAVLNNNIDASPKQFNSVNVGLLLQVIAAAKAAGIARLVNVTSFHTIDGSRSAYADSKRRALDVLDKEDTLAVLNVFLPAVYGDDFAGRLSIVKKLPPMIRPAVLVVLTALVPTLHIDRLSAFIDGELSQASADVMLCNSQDQNTVYRMGKRTIDLAFSLTLISLAWWFLFMIWVLVRCTSTGSGIFAQERIGQYGKLFTCYKFRTMRIGTIQAGTHEVNSSAVTSIGYGLRRLKIDELPQVVNILRGEMSLVGPRPCLPSQKELISSRSKHGVLNITPGVTGLAQVHGIDMSQPEKLAINDALYVAQRGLLLDIKIIFKTMIGGGRGDRTIN